MASAQRVVLCGQLLHRHAMSGPSDEGHRPAGSEPGRDTTPEATSDRSRGPADFLDVFRGLSAPRAAVLALAALAGILMVAADLSTIYSIDVISASCDDLADSRLADECAPSGGDRHTYALLLLGLLTLAMAWGAAAGRSVPAAFALLGVGVLVLAISLIGDLPDVNETGAIGRNFDEAKAHPEKGFYMEIAGGLLALVAGGLALRLRRSEGDG